MPTMQLEATVTGANVPDYYMRGGNRTTFTLSNGSSLILALNRLFTVITVWELNAAHTTKNLRATINLPAGVTAEQIVGASWTNNDLSIAFLDHDTMKTVRYCKLTYAGFAVSAWETVISFIGGNFASNIDMDVSDGGLVCLAVNSYNTTVNDATSNLWCKAVTGGAWVRSMLEVITNGPIAGGCDAVGVTALGSNSTGTRDIVIANAHGKTGKDYGIRISTIRVTEATAAGAAPVLRTTVMTGEASSTATDTFFNGRIVKLFRTATNEWTLIASHRAMNRLAGAMRGTWNGTAWAITAPLTTFVQGSVSDLSAIAASSQVFTVAYPYFGTDTVHNYVARFIPKGTGYTITWSGRHTFGAFSFYKGNYPYYSFAGGSGNRNLALSKMEIHVNLYYFMATNPFANGVMYAAVPLRGVSGNPITVLTPAHNSQITSANPNLSASVDIDIPFGQSRYKIQFQFAKDTSFITNLIDYIQPDTKYAAVVGTHNGTTVVKFIDILPTTYTMAGPVWYYRARLADEFGNFGPWTTTKNLTLAHPPTAVAISPIDGQLYFYGNGSINFDWRFTDQSATDYQTAFQVIAYGDTGAVIFDSGKVTGTPGTAKRYSSFIPTTEKDSNLSWTVKLWDSENTAGTFMPNEFFVLTDPPTATVTSPLADSIVTTGVPTFSADLSTGGGRAIREYTVSVVQSGQTVWSFRKYGPFGNTVSIARKIPQGILQDGQDYTVVVSLIDDLGMQGSSPFVSFTVDWIPPAAPGNLIIDPSFYNLEDEGYVSIIWDDTTREVATFTGWLIYRKSDMIDPNTSAVVVEGAWEVIHADYTVSAGYEFKDYFAPSNYKVSYRVAQTVNRDGQELESIDVSPFVCYPKSDGYWLIEPTSDQADADAFRLSIVTGDTFSYEQEESELVILGRGRVIQKGEKLGVKGSLDVQIRNSFGVTARQKRLRLVYIQDVTGQLWLRNPFGDTFKVNVSAMSIARLAGVGASEFVDVTIPYSEVT